MSSISRGYVAHTPNEAGEWQSLRTHLVAVADQARQFGEPLGLGDLAYWAGLLHDLGKYTPEFQRYLSDCHTATQTGGQAPRPGSASHKQAGAALSARQVASPLAFVILGHHGGVQSRGQTKEVVREWDEADLNELYGRASADCPELKALPNLAPLAAELCKSALETDLLIRMLFSCLVDADSLDTEAHSSPETAELRSRSTLPISHLAERLRCAQTALLSAAPPSALNALRREIYDEAVAAAARLPGVYRLTVPTGGGKTRTSLAFALEHAQRYGLERVIYAIPYTSIVEQTVEVFRDILGDEAVLEHHSAVEPPEWDAEDETLEKDRRRRLACQNWDAPLVVTTTVQLFESLFGNRPGRSRKVHRMARAVLVLDEVQSLPPKLLKPLVDGLRLLSEKYQTTVLLCTATQPALDQSALEQAGFADTPEIVPEPKRLFDVLKRVQYDLKPLQEAPWGWDRVAAAMRETAACLTVLNTRKDALAVLEALDDPEALHLSTLLCGRHRRDVLAEVRRRLCSDEPCRLVSTQVVECGCDLDFPRVLRALGPLDRIVQAAGRCNREGKRAAAESRVIVFRPAEGKAPQGAYRVGIESADRLLQAPAADLHDPELYDTYFRDVFAKVETDAKEVQKLRGQLDFPEVARQLRLIDEETVGVFVSYASAAAECAELLQQAQAASKGMSSALWRRVQPFLVSLSRREFEAFLRKGLVLEAAPDFWRWTGAYHPVKGLEEAQRDPMDLIV